MNKEIKCTIFGLCIKDLKYMCIIDLFVFKLTVFTQIFIKYVSTRGDVMNWSRERSYLIWLYFRVRAHEK